MLCRVALVLIYLASWPVFAEDAAKPAPPKDLLGCWQEDQEQGAYILFEADAVFFKQGDGGAEGGVSYAPGSVEVRAGGGQVSIAYAVAGDALTLTFPDKTKLTYTRCAQLPDGIKPKPVVFGAGKPDDQRIAAITAELDKRVVEDQAVRTDPAREQDMEKVDADNTRYLRDLVTEIGWIDAARFGAKAAQHAFLFVQHSGDLPLMKAALPEIEQDVKAKRLPDGQDYALLYDRVQMFQGRKQRYGSQITRNDAGEMVVYVLEDRANVDRRRAELGMGPLNDYLDYFTEQNGGKSVGFQEEAKAP